MTTAYSDTVAAGNVISQSQVGPAVSGTVVDLVVSDGPSPRIVSGTYLSRTTQQPSRVVFYFNVIGSPHGSNRTRMAVFPGLAGRNSLTDIWFGWYDTGFHGIIV